MSFLIKEIFIILFYCLSFTIILGGIFYYLSSTISTIGLNVKGGCCYFLILFISFILSFPLFGTLRLKRHTRNVEQSWITLLSTAPSTTLIDFNIPDEIKESVFLLWFLPDFKYDLLAEGIPTSISEIELIIKKYFSEVQHSLNIFFLKTLLFLGLGIIIPSFIFYRGAKKEERRQLLQRKLMELQ